MGKSQSLFLFSLCKLTLFLFILFTVGLWRMRSLSTWHCTDVGWCTFRPHALYSFFSIPGINFFFSRFSTSAEPQVDSQTMVTIHQNSWQDWPDLPMSSFHHQQCMCHCLGGPWRHSPWHGRDLHPSLVCVLVLALRVPGSRRDLCGHQTRQTPPNPSQKVQIRHFFLFFASAKDPGGHVQNQKSCWGVVPGSWWVRYLFALVWAFAWSDYTECSG